MPKLLQLFKFSLLFCLIAGCYGWDAEELELFDIVEEINQNFYDVLGIEQDAPSSEVRKAYRKLSIKLHPDKNKAPDAEEKFRQLVAVYEVLKDEGKRARYNEVLVSGLPDWRQPVFYYRRVRKLGLLELFGLLTIILTVGHGLVIWAIYLEKRFEMEEVFKSQRKKAKKGKKGKTQSEREAEMEEILEEELSYIPRPKWSDMLPVRVICFQIWMVKSVPGWISDIRERMKKEEVLEEEEDEDEEEEEKKKIRRKRVDVPDFIPTMAEDSVPVLYNVASADVKEEHVEKTNRCGQAWSDEEISLLSKAVAKFPSGVQGRWEKIAEMVGRSVNEVVSKAKEIRQGYAINVDPSAQGTTGAVNEKVHFKKGKCITNDITKRDRITDKILDIAPNKSAKTSEAKAEKILVPTSAAASSSSEKKGATEDDSTVWTQNQQKILEWALTQYPKGTSERWEKIAEHIPGKTKEDCVVRFKYLADIVRRKKLEAQKSS